MQYSKLAASPAAAEFRDLPLRFAFSGALGELLQQCLEQDASNWHLSPKFRLYYRLRRWIPIFLRHVLQQNRNKQLPVADAWYCHHNFLDQLRLVLNTESVHVSPPIIHPWPAGYTHAAVVTHDIETQEGLKRVDRLASLEEQAGIRSAWFFVPAKYRIDEGLLRDLQDRGHEVGIHGYNHDGLLFSSQPCFQQRAAKINSFVRQWHVDGFRAPMMHRELTWMQTLDVDYDASCFDVDPYQAMPGGVGGVWPFVVGRLVELPCTLPQDHTLFVTLGKQSTDIWKTKYALLQRLRGMALCIVHPDYLDTPQRWNLCRELLDEFLQSNTAWRCLPRELSAWWRQRDASRVVGQAIEGPATELGRIVELRELFAEFTA